MDLFGLYEGEPISSATFFGIPFTPLPGFHAEAREHGTCFSILKAGLTFLVDKRARNVLAYNRMDNNHIIDVYREAFSLVPMSADVPTDKVGEREMDKLKRAARVVESKHSELTWSKQSYYVALIMMEVGIFVCMLVFVAFSIRNMRAGVNRVLYSVFTLFIFSLAAILLYYMIFAQSISEVNKARLTMRHIYGFDAEHGSATVDKLYSLAKSIRVMREQETSDPAAWCAKSGTEEPAASEVSEKERALESALDPAIRGCGDESSGKLRWWMQNGLLYTITDDMVVSVDDFVTTVRNMIGSDTYRPLDEDDMHGIVDSIILPRLAEALSVAHDSSAGAAAPSPDDAARCGAECEQTVSSLVEAVLDEKKPSPPATVLEGAWQNCPGEMERACRTALLDKGTAAQKCEFGCGRAEKQRRIVKVPVDGWVPIMTPDSGWRAREDQDNVPCLDAGTADEGVDVTYFGNAEEGQAKRCYFHDSHSKRAEWKRTPGAEGVMAYAHGANVTAPSADPKHVADAIVSEILGVYSSFDVKLRDEIVLDKLRETDARFWQNEPWYRDTLTMVRQRLKASKKKKSLVVPSIEHLNANLEDMTGREFVDRLMWPAAMASAALHVRRSRMSNSNFDTLGSAPSSWSARDTLLFIIFVVLSVVAYAIVATESLSRQFGEITLSGLADRWQRHLLAASGMMIFWSVVGIHISQVYSKNHFNARVTQKNTVAFIESVTAMRDWLFALTKTLPDLAGDDHASQKFERPRLELMIAVHRGDTGLIKGFKDPDMPMSRVLTNAQRIEFAEKAQAVIQYYDSCNHLRTRSGVPFPTPDVVIYASGMVLAILVFVYMSQRFRVHESAARVRQVIELRKAMRTGDADAAKLVRGILLCADTETTSQMYLIKTMFVTAASVFSVMILGLLVVGHKKYRLSLESGFLVTHSQCLV